MLNDQLLEYVKSEAARGVHRGPLQKVLIEAGWPPQEVSEVLIALAVPTDAPAAPVEPSAAVMPTGQGAPAPVVAGSDPTPGSVPTAPLSAPASVPGAYGEGAGKIAGVFTLIKNGFSIYGSRFGVLVSIGALQLLVTAICLGAGAGAVLGGAFALSLAARSGIPAVAVIAVAGVVGLLLFVLFIWLLSWFTVASMHTIRGSAEKISFAEAFGRARPQVWQFIWLGIIRLFVLLGAVALFAVIPALILGGGTIVAAPYLGTLERIFLTVIVVLFGIGVLAVVVLFSTRLIFGAWILVNGEGKGFGALAQSRILSLKHFGAIFWRVFALLLILAVLQAVIRIPLGMVFGNPSVSAGHPEPTPMSLIGTLISMALSALVITPLLMSVFYTLYASVRNVVGIREVSPAVSKNYGILAILGVILLILMPVAGILLAMSHGATLPTL